MAADYILLQRKNTILSTQVRTLKDKVKNYKGKVKILNSKVVNLLHEKKNTYDIESYKENRNNQNIDEYYQPQKFHAKRMNYQPEDSRFEKIIRIPKHVNEQYQYEEEPPNFDSFSNNLMMNTEPLRVREINDRKDMYIDFESENGDQVEDFYKSLPVDNLFRKVVNNNTHHLTSNRQENMENEGII